MTVRRSASRDDWTDFNESDPGITLLELFAYLTDALTYYIDAIAAEQRRRRRRSALAAGGLLVALLVGWRSTHGADNE